MPDRDRSTDRESELLRILATETREELVKADSKAALALSCLSAAFAALLGALGTGSLEPQHYSPFPMALFWIGCATWIPAIVTLGLAVAPRPGRPRLTRAHYFADASAAPSARLFAEIIRGTDIKDRDLDQFLQLSRIVQTKYRCVQYGMLWGAAFMILTATSLLIGTSG
jgi:hypothetical protein